MKFMLDVFYTEGSILAEDNKTEVSRVLDEVSQRVANGETHGRILDLNNQRVGNFRLEADA